MRLAARDEFGSKTEKERTEMMMAGTRGGQKMDENKEPKRGKMLGIIDERHVNGFI
jgi:hypothetical protein